MRRAYVATALLCAWSVPAVAGPPYVTDDPVPTDLGRWEIYGFGSGTLFRHGAESNGGFDVNYGGAKDLQLSAVVSLDYAHASGLRDQLGIADTEIGAKYRFVHRSSASWLPDIGFFPKLELPTAGRRFGSGRVGASFPLWAQKGAVSLMRTGLHTMRLGL